MLIDKINLNHLRVFEAIYRLGSTVEAATELHLTQSGISQHLKNLEGQLNKNLFDRINRKLVPTHFARTLYGLSHKGLLFFENALSELLEEQSHLRGLLSIGMPPEFGTNCVLNALANFARKHPDVKLEIRYGMAGEMNDLLLAGKLDFAFVDELAMSPLISKVAVYDEAISMFASAEYIKNHASKLNHKFKEDRAYFETLEYIDYLPHASILRRWFSHHLNAKTVKINVRCTAQEVQGVSKLIFSHIGAGILPEHHAAIADPEGKLLHRFKGSSRSLFNKISLASMTERTHSPVAQKAKEEISEFLKTFLKQSGY